LAINLLQPGVADKFLFLRNSECSFVCKKFESKARPVLELRALNLDFAFLCDLRWCCSTCMQMYVVDGGDNQCKQKQRREYFESRIQRTKGTMIGEMAVKMALVLCECCLLTL
jgi:hypothetical protein